MAEAVAQAVPEGLQDRANTLINGGTGVGVALSGPAALLLSGQWRVAWAAFALVGTAVVLWNAAVMTRAYVEVGPDAPGSRETPDDPKSGRPFPTSWEPARGRARRRSF